jgi:hypothetical protein
MGVGRTDSIDESRSRRLARPILVACLVTFMAARILVFLIVSQRVRNGLRTP